MIINHALILAAGRGLRMMPDTSSKPKALMSYKQSTLINTGIKRIRPYISHIHVTVGYKADLLASHLVGLDISSIINTSGYPNSWWIHNSLLSLLDEPIFVLTCDNVTDIDFDLLAEDYVSLGRPPCMLVPVTPVPGIDGDYISHENNFVTYLSRDTPTTHYASGIQIINPKRVAKLTSSCGGFTQIWSQLISTQDLMVSRVTPSHWQSFDTMEQLKSAV